MQNGIAQNGESHIIFAEDLAPSDTAQLDRAKVLGLVTAKGSANSHTAILARTMGLPAITGIGDAFDPADDGHVAVIDGASQIAVFARVYLPLVTPALPRWLTCKYSRR